MKKSLQLIIVLLVVIAFNLKGQLPAAVTVERHEGSGDYDGTDSITVMVHFEIACTPVNKESVEDKPEICMHGAAIATDAADSTWGSWGIDWNATPGDGSPPTFTAVTGGFAKGLIPNKYFVVPDGETTRGMSFVFNGCDNWTSELKDDFDLDGTCNDFYIYWVDVPDVVGVNTIILSEFNVFPNPAGDFINVASEFASLKVYDIIGKEIISVKTISRSREYQLKTSSLQTGIYLIVVENFDGSMSMKKFSKK